MVLEKQRGDFKMSATYSVETLIAHRFDKFYDECEFQDIELSWKIKDFLDELELDMVEIAKDRSTTEAEDIYETGYNDGHYDTLRWTTGS